ncbi:MAG: UvrD-helicase domain-containing protein [Clostridia bacterium]|nr:UvrD-helicase domain-containing protein [Clostridia bacterium]
MSKWTKSQEFAIKKRDENLLVSAGAGSGKTSVMIARIVDLVSKEKVPIENFLVVTFTRASATDMKNKLISELEKMQDDAFVLEQIENVGTSDVSSLHSFCARLLKTYFYQIGLDPSFVVLDEVEMKAISNKALGKLMEESANNGDAEMFELADVLNKNRNEDGFGEAIVKFSEFLKSLNDPQSWFDDCIEKCYCSNLEKNICARILNDKAVAIFERYMHSFNAFAKQIADFDDKPLLKYVENLQFIANLVSQSSSIRCNFDNLMGILDFGRMPSKVANELVDIKEQIKRCKDAFQRNISDLKKAWGQENFDTLVADIEINKRRVITLKRLALRYDELLSEQKSMKGGLDYNDLEICTLKLLENESVVNALKEQYKYIFVDEYQDISPIQEKIIQTIAGKDNRFMVGDIKQSIYRFRLCDPDIFLAKYNQYKAGSGLAEAVDLNENFRSHYKILDFCNFIFSKCYTKSFGGLSYEVNGKMVFGPEQKWENQAGGNTVGVYFNDTTSLKAKEDIEEKDLTLYSVKNHEYVDTNDIGVAKAEASVIYNKISELVGTKIYDVKQGRLRPLKFSDFVVLLASRGPYLRDFVKALKDLGVPVASDYSEDVLQDDDILAILNLLKIVDNMADDYSLISVMVSKLFAFSYNELAEIKRHFQKTQYFYEIFVNFDKNCNISQKLKAKVVDFLQKIAVLKKYSQIMPVNLLMEKVKQMFNIELLLLASADRIQKKQRFARFEQTFGEISLAEYLQNLENSSITCEAVPEGDAVRVMTIHGSKGLEFPVVFVANCGKQFSGESWKSDLLFSKDYGVGLKFYDKDFRYKTENLVRSAIRIVEEYKTKEEQLRLFYVALTRAVNYLFVIASGEADEVENYYPNEYARSFLDWLAPAILDKFDGKNSLKNIADVKIYDAKSVVDRFCKKEAAQVLFSEKNEEKIDKLQKYYKKQLENRGEKYPAKTSVTRLNQQEEQVVPVLFDENEKGFSADLGTAYHKVLQYANFSEQNLDDVNNLVSKLQKDCKIDNNLAKSIDGCVVLKAIKTMASIIRSGDAVHREQEFLLAYDPLTKSVSTGGEFMVVQGVCDLVIERDKDIVIVDYKLSGKNAGQLKETYAEQLRLYAIAMEKAFGKKVSEKYILKLSTSELVAV